MTQAHTVTIVDKELTDGSIVHDVVIYSDEGSIETNAPISTLLWIYTKRYLIVI